MSGDEGPDLDDELRRLFSDDRLTLPVAEGATGAVVAGARKRRRHRMAVAAAGGVLAVTGLVFAGAALTGIGRPLGSVTAASGLSASLTATSAPSTTSAAAVPNGRLGPFGGGGVTLGMPVKDVLASGMRLTPEKGFSGTKCITYRLIVPTTIYYDQDPLGAPRTTGALSSAGKAAKEQQKEQQKAQGSLVSTPPPSALQRPVIIEATIDAEGTVIQVGGDTTLRTPADAGVGSDVGQLVRAYPNFDRPFNGKELRVSVPGNPKADYLFILDGAGQADRVWLTWDDDADSACVG